MQNSLGAVVAVGLGILLIALVIAGRFKATWAAITGRAPSTTPPPAPDPSAAYVAKHGGGFDGPAPADSVTPATPATDAAGPALQIPALPTSVPDFLKQLQTMGPIG